MKSKAESYFLILPLDHSRCGLCLPFCQP